MKNNQISKNECIILAKKLEKELGRRPKKRDDDSLNQRVRKIFGSWNNFMKAAGYDVKYYQKVKLPSLDKNLAYFLGLLITDGHVQFDESNKKYKVAIYTSYPDERDALIRLIKLLFGYNAALTSRMYGFNKKPNYEVRISSKKLVCMLIDKFGIPSGAKSLNIRVPEVVVNGDLEIRTAFLLGVIDGDGSIGKGVTISSGSEEFLADLKILLRGFSMTSGEIYRHANCNTKEIKLHKCGFAEIRKWYNLSEFCYPRKKNAINNI